MEKEYKEKLDVIALEIMILARNTLLTNLRYLDRTISSLPFEISDYGTFASDGVAIYYNADYVVNAFAMEQNVINRNLLHTMLHSIFRHSFVGKEISKLDWDLSTDIAIEHAINELDKPCVNANRRIRQEKYFALINKELGSFSAERLYRWLLESDFSDDEKMEMRLAFMGDDHSIWYGVKASEKGSTKRVDLEKLWKDISKRMEQEMEHMLHDEGFLLDELKRVNRVKRDYKEFLRRFGEHGEVMRLSEDEFDYVYYSFGMEHYGNIPFIEPLEYREANEIKEFVIAIDTSGSVRGDKVTKFIETTFGILRSKETFSRKVNIHIIQCDDAIREDIIIKDVKDIENYVENLEIKGLGETDFRPVFSYVDELIKDKVIKKLQGLIYFTDGKGTFPEKVPAFDSVFVIYDDGGRKPDIPDDFMYVFFDDDMDNSNLT